MVCVSGVDGCRSGCDCEKDVSKKELGRERRRVR